MAMYTNPLAAATTIGQFMQRETRNCLWKVTDTRTQRPYSQAMLGYLFARSAEIYARHKEQPQTHHRAYFDGIICGHTHVPEVRDFPSPVDKETGEFIGPATVTYLNTGHWTGRLDEDEREGAASRASSDAPTCTAIVEHAVFNA